MKPKLVKDFSPEEQATMSCILCTGKVDNEFLYGKFYTIGRQQQSLSVHYHCLYFASGLEQKGKESQGIFGFLKKDIENAAQRGEMIECHECHTNGATVSCSNTTCKRMYHFPCTITSLTINQYFGEFKSFCIDHRPIQKVPKSYLRMSQPTCIICQEEMPTPEPSFELLWAPCCKKKSWFHRDCIQGLALSAGCHFFKCPICSNSEIFLKAMQEMGIYVPNQDASWELEPNAFQDLYQRHNQCDHPTCICPKGRSYVGRSWKLMLCSSCGSKGIHTSCGKLDPKRNEWNCENCRQVAEIPGKRSRQNPSNMRLKSAALKRTFPARKERSSTKNNDISEDESEVEIVSTVSGSSSAYSSCCDPKPVRIAAPPKRASKRCAVSIQEDDVTTIKKGKMSKAQKVVQLKSGGGAPKSPVSRTPSTPVISAKKTPAKTPNVNTSIYSGSPNSSQMPEYRPPLTRSARKKAEMDATVGTPRSKGVTPSGKKLNTAGTTKIRTSARKAKGKKVIRVEEVEEEEDEDDLDPPEESNNINSDCDLDKHSYDAESDKEEEEDEREAELSDEDLENDAESLESGEIIESEDEIEEEEREVELSDDEVDNDAESEEEIESEGEIEEATEEQLAEHSITSERFAHIRCGGCRQLGHVHANCPTANRTIKCYKCGEIGHHFKMCVIKREVYPFAYCYICKVTGHPPWTCPNKGPIAYCYLCKVAGHPHWACRTRGRSCYNCQEKTHLAKDCPKGMKKNVDPKILQHKETLYALFLAGKLSLIE